MISRGLTFNVDFLQFTHLDNVDIKKLLHTMQKYQFHKHNADIMVSYENADLKKAID